MAINTFEINEIESLGEIRDEWSQLLEATPDANFFQTLGWLEVFWKHYGDSRHLRVIGVREGDQLIGVLPLMTESAKTQLGHLRFLTYPLNFWGSFYGPIGPRRDEILQASIDHVRSTPRDWDVFELRYTGSHNEGIQTADRIMRQSRLAPVVREFESTAVIDQRGTWDDYIQNRGGRWRRNHRRWEKQVSQLGEITFVRYRGNDEASDMRWDLFDQCINISRKSWQSKSDDGTTLCSESILPFIKDSHRAAVEEGCVDMALLYADETPVAYAYHYTYNGYVFGLRIGYDSNLDVKGTGNVLYCRMIEDNFSRGYKIYDQGPGSLEAKAAFYTEIRPIYAACHHAMLSPRSQLLRLKRKFSARSVVLS